MAGKTNINELARRYVTAVYELAEEGKNLAKVTKDFESLGNALAESADLQKVINSPILGAEKQIIALEEVGKKAKFNAVTINFLKVVASNGRLNVLPAVVTAFKAKVAEEQGEVAALVTSPAPLTAAKIKEIQTELSKVTKKKVIVSETVDPSLIGGLVVKIGSKMYDFSVKSQLNKIKNELKQAS